MCARVCIKGVHGILLPSLSDRKVKTTEEISFLFLFMVSTEVSTYLGGEKSRILSNLDTYGLVLRPPPTS